MARADILASIRSRTRCRLDKLMCMTKAIAISRSVWLLPFPNHRVGKGLNQIVEVNFHTFFISG
jgi:hypothetical protein